MRNLKRKLNFYVLEIIITLIVLTVVVSMYCWGRSVNGIDQRIKIYGTSATQLGGDVTFLIAILNHKNSKNREVSILLHKEKQKAYQHFYNSMFSGLEELLKKKYKSKINESNDTEDESNKNNLDKDSELKDFNEFDIELEKFSEMLKFKKALMNWGSQELINSFIDYENKIAAEESLVVRNQIINDFLKAIRKDLDHNDSDDIQLNEILLDPKSRTELKLLRSFSK